MEPREPAEYVDGDDVHGKRYRHPAFGQVGASRVQGDTTLYGSDFEHRAFMIVRIARSELWRNLSHDWHMGGDELIEIAMSESQWAAFLSSPNVGQGVPCTLRHVNGARMPGIDIRRERDVVRTELHERAEDMASNVTDAIAAVEALTGSLSKTKRESILGHLRTLEQELSENVRFHVQSFEAHIERTVDNAKVEVNAYVEARIMRAGLEAIKLIELGAGAGD